MGYNKKKRRGKVSPSRVKVSRKQHENALLAQRLLAKLRGTAETTEDPAPERGQSEGHGTPGATGDQ